MGTTNGVWTNGASRDEVRQNTAIMLELSRLVDEGLLEMGVSDEGEALYWPTPLGCEVLGMEPV